MTDYLKSYLERKERSPVSRPSARKTGFGSFGSSTIVPLRRNLGGANTGGGALQLRVTELPKSSSSDPPGLNIETSP